jgi:alpha-tubulin suppressor-like RCC1 family protein
VQQLVFQETLLPGLPTGERDPSLGNGTTNAPTDVPVKMSLPPGVTAAAVSKDNNSALALSSDGSIYAWGYIVGELGNDTTTNSDVPVKVNLPAGMIATRSGAAGRQVWPSSASRPLGFHRR